MPFVFGEFALSLLLLALYLGGMFTPILWASGWAAGFGACMLWDVMRERAKQN